LEHVHPAWNSNFGPGPTDNLHPTPLACNCHQVLKELPNLRTLNGAGHDPRQFLYTACRLLKCDKH